MSITNVQIRNQPQPRKLNPPPLESGDRLSRAEFERRYHAHPGIKKAELVEGVVYKPSATRHKRRVYARNGVQEYLVVQMYERRID